MEKGDKAPRIFNGIIKDDAFGISMDEVTASIKETRKNLEDWTGALSDPDEKMQRAAQRALPNVEKEVSGLTSMSEEEILAYVERIYRKAKELEGEASEDAAIDEINKEFPFLLSLYPLLRKSTWGYRLGQMVIAKSVRSQ